MCFSDNLRIKICKKFSIDLEPFVWTDELNNYLMNIHLDICEELVHSMSEVYELGLNIGYCGLTSRYFARALPNAKLAIGVLPILKGTKSSKDGNHAWIINDGYVIDSTLRLLIPEEIAANLGYTIDRILAYDSARMLSEYELYSNAAAGRLRDINKYNESLLNIN